MDNTLEYLLSRGLVRKGADGNDYIIIKSPKSPRGSAQTVGASSEYAVKVSDFLKAFAKVSGNNVSFNNTNTGLTADTVQAAIAELSGLTTIVNISSAQILAMGTTAVQLLPAPGVGEYYDVEKILLEVTGTVNYTVAADAYLYVYDNIFSAVYASDLLGGYASLDEQSTIAKMVSSPATISADDVPRIAGLGIGRELKLEYYSDGGPANPTLGNGTMRAIIEYKIRTFGA